MANRLYATNTVNNKRETVEFLTMSLADRLISALNPYVALICSFQSGEQSLDVTSATVITYLVEK